MKLFQHGIYANENGTHSFGMTNRKRWGMRHQKIDENEQMTEHKENQK